MKLSQRLKDEKEYVEKVLGLAKICDRCGANLSTYADRCSADLSEICPGFTAIENAKEQFDAARKDQK